MRTVSRFSLALLIASAMPFESTVLAEQSRQDARVTQLVREVNLLEAAAPPCRAVLNETVPNGSGVRTGSESRAELTFRDATITRLGANSLYSFKKAGPRNRSGAPGTAPGQAPAPAPAPPPPGPGR